MGRACWRPCRPGYGFGSIWIWATNVVMPFKISEAAQHCAWPFAAFAHILWVQPQRAVGSFARNWLLEISSR